MTLIIFYPLHGYLQDLSEFDKTCKIGTGSPRRTEQIASINPDVIVKPIRGNIDTRIDKLKLKEYDGIVLALAGIKWLGLEKHISYIFDYGK